MSGFNATQLDGSATPIPMSSAVTPGDKTPHPIKGGPAVTDAQGNPLVGVGMYLYDGDNETFGKQNDAAATTDTGTFSFMALFKRALQKLTSLVTNTNAFSSLGTDQAASMIKVSVYGTNAANGDTPLPINASGNLKMNISGVSAGVAISTNQTGTPTETSVTVGVASGTALAANANAKMRLFINDSPNIIYLSTSGAAAALNAGIRLNANGGSVLFDRFVPTGIVKAIATAANSNLLVVEG